MPSTAQTTKPSKPTYLKDVVLLFAVPLGIALIAAVLVYVPQLLTKPGYDFVYSYCGDYRCVDSYRIASNGRITQEIATDISDLRSYTMRSKLLYFDVSDKSTRPISVSEANTLNLINSSKSPDGYTLDRNTGSGGGFLFWGEYRDEWQLANGWKKAPVKLTQGTNYYENNLEFLGWVGK